MEQQQLVDKITHLETQLKRLESFDFGIRTTFAYAGYLSRRIAHYRKQMNKEETVFDSPISA